MIYDKFLAIICQDITIHRAKCVFFGKCLYAAQVFMSFKLLGITEKQILDLLLTGSHLSNQLWKLTVAYPGVGLGLSSLLFSV